MIVQYNCQQFDCPADLIERLTAIVQSYPTAYLAPHPRLAAMIALSAFNRSELLDELDEGRIYSFLRARQ